MRVKVVINPGPIDYGESLQFMERNVKLLIDGEAEPLLWFLSYPHIYTMGSSATDDDVIDLKGIPLYSTGRGGKITYHGPGQSIIYPILPILSLYRALDIKRYVRDLEVCVISALSDFGIRGYTMEGKIGVWCDGPSGLPCKIAAIGVRVRRGVTMHGLAVNLHTDLSKFEGIIPCGIRGYGVTSCEELGVEVSLNSWCSAMINHFQKIFLITTYFDLTQGDDAPIQECGKS